MRDFWDVKHIDFAVVLHELVCIRKIDYTEMDSIATVLHNLLISNRNFFNLQNASLDLKINHCYSILYVGFARLCKVWSRYYELL